MPLTWFEVTSGRCTCYSLISMKSTEAAGQASSAFRNVDESEKASFPLNFFVFLRLPGIFRVCALKTSNVAVPGKRPTQKDENEVNVFAEFQHSKSLTDSENTKQLQKHEKIQKKIFLVTVNIPQRPPVSCIIIELFHMVIQDLPWSFLLRKLTVLPTRTLAGSLRISPFDLGFTTAAEQQFSPEVAVNWELSGEERSVDE